MACRVGLPYLLKGEGDEGTIFLRLRQEAKRIEDKRGLNKLDGFEPVSLPHQPASLSFLWGFSFL